MISAATFIFTIFLLSTVSLESVCALKKCVQHNKAIKVLVINLRVQFLFIRFFFIVVGGENNECI